MQDRKESNQHLRFWRPPFYHWTTNLFYWSTMSTNARTRWTLPLCACINQNTNGTFIVVSQLLVGDFWCLMSSNTHSSRLLPLCTLEINNAETLQVNYFLDSKEWYFTFDSMVTSVTNSLSLTYSTHYYLFWLIYRCACSYVPFTWYFLRPSHSSLIEKVIFRLGLFKLFPSTIKLKYIYFATSIFVAIPDFHCVHDCYIGSNMYFWFFKLFSFNYRRTVIGFAPLKWLAIHFQIISWNTYYVIQYSPFLSLLLICILQT